MRCSINVHGCTNTSAQEQANSAATSMFVAFAVEFIIATQKTTPYAARCDVVKGGIVYRNQLLARLRPGPPSNS